MRWLDQLSRADTRTMAAVWLKANAPKGARVAVENNGPTYLGAAGFAVLGTEAPGATPEAWIYYPQTGEIKANLANSEVDSKGDPYNTY